MWVCSALELRLAVLVMKEHKSATEHNGIAVTDGWRGAAPGSIAWSGEIGPGFADVREQRRHMASADETKSPSIGLE